jgi:hypothetical protein
MACGVCARSTRRAASLPGEGSTHLRGCGMTAVGTFETCRRHLRTSVDRGRPEVTGRLPKPSLLTHIGQAEFVLGIPGTDS